MSDRLLTVQEFARAMNVTVACIRRWLLEGRVAKVKLGRLVRIPEGECQRLIAEGLCPVRQTSRTSQQARTPHTEGGR